MHQRLGLTVAVGIAAALIAAGCGSSNSSTTTTSLTKAEFLAKANAICKAGTAKQTAAQESLGKNPSQAQLQAYVKGVAIPTIQSQINAVRALGAPAGDEAKVNAMLALAQADLNKIKTNLGLISHDNTFANFAAVAHPYGMTSCAPHS